MSEELKPCPFCGSKNVKLDQTDETPEESSDVWVYCEECLCDGPNASTDIFQPQQLEQVAISLWNERSFLESEKS